jgi:hypothetical protein
MNPIKLRNPRPINAIDITPNERKEPKGEPPPPAKTAEIDANMEKIKNPYNTTIMTGTITYIKLAVRPSFLLDSNDILTLQGICSGLGISFSKS